MLKNQSVAAAWASFNSSRAPAAATATEEEEEEDPKSAAEVEILLTGSTGGSRGTR